MLFKIPSYKLLLETKFSKPLHFKIIIRNNFNKSLQQVDIMLNERHKETGLQGKLSFKKNELF